MSELAAEIARIRVMNQPEMDVNVDNQSRLELIGAGRQGAVFRVNPVACVKVFGNEEDCSREFYALSLGQSSDLFPRVYEKGPNYIVMEYVSGVDLREYLQSQPLTVALSMKLIDMLTTFKHIGLERIDHHKRQIFVQADGRLKVIDVGRTVWRNRIYPYPRKLLNSLGTEHRTVFLEHVKTLSAELYQEWQMYIRLEQFARQVFQKLAQVPAELELETIRNECALLSNELQGVPVEQLEALFYKVFKEEHWKRAYGQALAAEVALEQSREVIKQQVRLEILREIEEQMLHREDELWQEQHALEERARRYSRRSKREQVRDEAVKVRDERFAIRRLRKALLRDTQQ